MDFINKIIEEPENMSIIINIFSLIIPLFGLIIKGLKEYSVVTREEKVVKYSIMGKVVEKRIWTILIIQPLVGIVLGLLGIPILINVVEDINNLNPKIYFVSILIITFVASEFLVPYIKKNRSEFLENLIKNNKKLRFINILLYYFPSIALNVGLIIITIHEIPANYKNTLILSGVILCVFLISTLHFNAIYIAERYSHAHIYFNNSYSKKDFPYRSIKIDKTSFVTVKYRQKQTEIYTSYNNNIIKKIDFIVNDEIDEKFNDHLYKKGFLK